MSGWSKGDVAFQPNHGVVGRVVELGVLDDFTARVTLQADDAPPTPTLKLESGDELIAAGCVRGTLPQLYFHDVAIESIARVLKALAVFGASLGLHPTTALAILKGVMARQSALLNQPGGSDDHQAEQGLPNRG